ncbi:extracellular solute-binding protein [Occultella glacieicola]|uniref:Extracellular solute-binding protein n=1 Tax=Occultella glacieicola TaxID=2518684 RepID=A0ABY2E532_9MICO|nr:extracellular solute-binding protein [Occultella glacieicola]TDE95130.1 extracellular solute-binding protein [Occultella glacieicola]
MSARIRRRRTRLVPALAGLAALSMVAVACAPAGGNAGDGGGDADGGATEFTFLTTVENPQIRDELTRLSENQCSAENEALPLVVDTIPQADVNQRVSVLASQDALPVMFVSPTSESKVGGDMYESGALLDLEETLTDLGAWEDVLPAAASTVNTIYGDMVSLPFQYNIEGFWYNKAIFAENGLEVPTTWDDFTEAAATLQEAGVQPLTASGGQGWTITRYISTYLARAHGVDALAQVSDGAASFTDPDYLVAAQELAGLGEAGYFGQGIVSRDMDTVTAEFFGGSAAMMYNGSWVLSNVYDEEDNTVGVDNIGFFPFPEVTGGAGSIDDYPANTGTVTAVSAALYNDKVGDWLACIAENYGSSLLENQGAISGFAQNTEVEGVEPLVAEITERMASAEDAVIWLEGPFGQRFGDAAGLSAGSLVDGGISPEDYMAQIQDAVEAE